MIQQINIAIAQLNYTVGAIDDNLSQIKENFDKAVREGADLVVFSELAIIGYPAEDLVLRPQFVKKAMEALHTLATHTAHSKGAILVGSLLQDKTGLYNAAILLADGKIQSIARKVALPNFGVFDEKRLFTAGTEPSVISFKGVKMGILVCRDLWVNTVTQTLASKECDIIIALNASPYYLHKHDARNAITKDIVAACSCPMIYINQVGGQDELVFDGNSFIMDKDGTLQVTLPFFAPALYLSHWQFDQQLTLLDPPSLQRETEVNEGLYQGAMMGLRDYVNKNGFTGVILGLSGGIDSALSAVIATDALGKDRVKTYMLPSQHTSDESIQDAIALARNVGITIDTIPITSSYESILTSLSSEFSNTKEDITEENIQSRLRAVILMALSNKFGYMLLATGNKSEMAVGYSTIYGDLCGGYSVLKDLYKSSIYSLSKWRNQFHTPDSLCKDINIIPSSIITKAPTAELRPNQTDQDTLPPYDILDAILYRFIECEASKEQIIQAGYDATIVEQTIALVMRSEYKRRQAPPGVKLSMMGFGRDRRYPITNHFKE